MFGGETVIDGQHLKTRSGAGFRADIVVTFQTAEDKAAAMKIENGRPIVRDFPLV